MIGGLAFCATSIRLARTKAGSSEKTRWAFRTTCFHLWRRWQLDSATSCRFGAATMILGIRDFIHVVDLASGHLSVLSQLKRPGVLTVNLGTGSGSSVLEVIRTFAAVSGRSVPYEIGERRAGDVAICYADPTLAKEALGWKSVRSLAQMCADHWRWQSKNPYGYRGT